MTSVGSQRSIVVGCFGQDGTLLIEDLEKQGHDVFGIGRGSLYRTQEGIIADRQINIFDISAIEDLILHFAPDEVYYLPAYHISSQEVQQCSIFESYSTSYDVHVKGLLCFLSAIAIHKPSSRLFYASSSLVFSGENGDVQSEDTPWSPIGPYALTKTMGMELCKEFRETHNVFASVGILYNHESHLRHPKFLSQKIIQSAWRIAEGATEKCVIGNLSSRVDWGYAKDYVKAFQNILRIDHSTDFIVSTGEANSVQSFVELTFSYFGLDWRDHVVENDKILTRRLPVKVGNNNKLKELTGWTYERSFSELIKKLIDDTRAIRRASN